MPELTSPSKWPSLNLIYDEIRGRIAYQDGQISSLDSKANFGLGSATLLTAGVTGLASAIADVGTPVAGKALGAGPPPVVDLWIFGTPRADAVADALTIASLLVYGLVVWFSYMAYRVRDWHVTPNPQEVLIDAASWQEEETKATLAVKLADDFRLNEPKIHSKARWVRWGMKALMGEAVLLLIIAIVQVRL